MVTMFISFYKISNIGNTKYQLNPIGIQFYSLSFIDP